jgi:hypothetical protein
MSPPKAKQHILADVTYHDQLNNNQQVSIKEDKTNPQHISYRKDINSIQYIQLTAASICKLFIFKINLQQTVL